MRIRDALASAAVPRTSSVDGEMVDPLPSSAGTQPLFSSRSSCHNVTIRSPDPMSSMTDPAPGRRRKLPSGAGLLTSARSILTSTLSLRSQQFVVVLMQPRWRAVLAALTVEADRAREQAQRPGPALHRDHHLPRLQEVPVQHFAQRDDGTGRDPERRSRCSHSVAGASLRRADKPSISSARLATLAPMVTKRLSTAHSGAPTSSHSRRQNASWVTNRARYPDPVSKSCAGTVAVRHPIGWRAATAPPLR